MDTFKKIYISLMVLIVIALIVGGLYITGTIDLAPKITADGIDDTGPRILTAVEAILITGFLFSRSANVIANRKNTAFGYIGLFMGLATLLLTAIDLIFPKFDMPDIAVVIFTAALCLSAAFVLIFEIPPANSKHIKFQRIIAGILGVLVLFFIILSISVQSSETMAASIANNFDGISKFIVFLLVALAGGFILNPILRVYYLESDYAVTNDIDDIIANSTNKFQTTPQPNQNQILMEKYKNQQAQVQTVQNQQPPTPQIQQPLPQPTISEVGPVVQEIPREKVVNEKFHQEDLPEAIIPSIDVEPVPAPTTEPVPTPVNQEPISVPVSSEPTPVVQTPPTQPEPVITPNPTPPVQ